MFVNSKSNRRSFQNEGATMIEYVLLLSFIAMVSLSGMKALGSGVFGTFITSAQTISPGSIPPKAPGPLCRVTPGEGGGSDGCD